MMVDVPRAQRCRLTAQKAKSGELKRSNRKDNRTPSSFLSNLHSEPPRTRPTSTRLAWPSLREPRNPQKASPTIVPNSNSFDLRSPNHLSPNPAPLPRDTHAAEEDPQRAINLSLHNLPHPSVQAALAEQTINSSVSEEKTPACNGR